MKTFRFNAVFGSLILLALLLTGCGSEEKVETKEKSTSNIKIDRSSSMVIRATSDARVVHPLYANDRLSLTLVNNIFSQIAIISGTTITEIILAESIEVSDDFLTYTLHLKKELKWHDGEPITADDIIFTTKTISDPNQGSHLAEMFKMPDGSPIDIKKVDNYTVTFKLPSPQVDFIATIAGIRPFPKHIYGGIANIKQSEVVQTPIGSGPYKFSEVKAGEYWVLSKFDDYCLGMPKIDNIIYRIIPDDTTAQFAFENGELDSMYISPEDVDGLKDKANILAFDENRVGYIILNQNNKALKDKKIRQAIGYAIDRDQVLLAKYLSEEFAKPAKTFLSEQSMSVNNNVEAYDYNPEKAKELIKESGEKNIKLTLAYIGKNDSRELLVKQYLESVGIQVELKAMDLGAFYDALFDPKKNNSYDIAFNGYIYGELPSSYENIFKTGNPENVNNYSNKKVDELFKQAALELNSEKRDKMYKKIQELVMEDVPMYPISYGYAIVAVNPRIKGLDKVKTASIYMFRDLSKAYIK